MINKTTQQSELNKQMRMGLSNSNESNLPLNAK